MRSAATAKLLVYGALSYSSMGPYATRLWGLKLLVYGALSYSSMGP
jgi:hypothetical protein